MFHFFRIRALAAILLSTLVVACVKPTKGPDESSGALFVVNTVTGEGAQNYEAKAVWKIPQSVTYTFHSCLSGVQAHEHLYGQSFNVEVPGTRTVYPVKTNTNSCFDWEETLPYNHYAGRSGWIILDRDIVGSGVYEGKKRIQIAVNPWATGSDARDKGTVAYVGGGEQKYTLTNLYRPEQGDRAFSGEIQGAARLIAQNVKIKSIPDGEDGKWVSLMVEVNLDPQIQSLNASGDVFYDPIKDGDFDMLIQVMASNVGAEMNQKVLLLGGNMHAQGKAVNGHLKAEFKVRQERRANQSNLELVLQIRPRSLNGHKTVEPFNGLFRFGSGTVVQDDGGSLANECLETPEACEYEKIVAGAANFESLMKAGYVRENDRYIFSNLKLRFTSILPGETTTRRTVVYTAQTCITDNQTGKSLANTPMKIRYISPNDGKVNMEPMLIEKSTDESGCLSWNGMAFHKYYEPEEFFEKEVVIQKGAARTSPMDPEAPPTPSFERHLKFYLNPWDDKFTFGWDSREFTQDFFDEIRSRKKIESRFFLSDYNYHTVRFLYNIDQFMELEVKKWVLMGLVPQVLRYSGIINARKMVEKLRDGIYLMKVAIEKDYLDPRDNSGWILKNSPEFQEEMENINGSAIRPKHYITTNTVLVRVVDGVIVYPVELTMRDLRLMRVRSNLLIQLELVDERLVQAYHVFKKYGIQDQDLGARVKDYADKLESAGGLENLQDVRKDLGGSEPVPDLADIEARRRLFSQSPDMTAARIDLDARVKHVQEIVRTSLERLKSHFETPGNMGIELESNGKTSGQPSSVQPGTSINDGFELRGEQLNELRSVLKVNDFSTVSFPKKEEIDLNLFVEKDAGLKKRTFVGPVIFLSNAYSDSMRATDNLDEANCEPANGKDAMETLEDLELKYEGNKEVAEIEYKLFSNRSNNAYQFSRYYNSLHNLCSVTVDDLIDEEKKMKEQSQDVLAASALKFNYVDLYNLKFISLTDEPLKRVDPKCTGRVSDCLIETKETQDVTLKAASLDGLINDNLAAGKKLNNVNWGNAGKSLRGIPFRAEKDHWTTADYQSLFYKHSPDSRVALCNVMSTKVARDLRSQSLSSVAEAVIYEKIMDICVLDGGMTHDVMYRVEKTGNYTFLGGLNLNFNVGEGFSVGTSTGWSTGIEMTDIVGAGAGLTGASLLKGAASILKPVNLKYGTGLSSSEGTNISESTYLVSQIAGFQVELTQYERCAAVRLTDQAVGQLATSWGDSKMTRAIGLGTANFTDESVQKIFKSGLLVCEGETRKTNPAVTVPESYFYFTQHFTEGDMLDQADLYNHPWLLALRGMRDFTMFVSKIRAQEVVNLPEFLYHVTGTANVRPKGWALEHLGEAYRDVMPTFPGFYTVLDDEPAIDVFALQQAQKRQAAASQAPPPGSYKLSKVDKDPLHEVIHPSLLKENADRVKAPLKPDGDLAK